MSLSSKTELARALFRTPSPDSVTRISGTATADSADGTVTVQLEDGDVIEVGTIGSVSSGDTVTIHVQRGEAQVIASEGWGDAMQAAVDEAQAIAEATGQHFWHDSNGAHVTEITQEQWAQSQTGHNILVNSYGMLLRDALTYLAAFSPSGVTFYDGGGNEEANITAKFGSNQAIVGADGSSRMVVDSTSIKGMNAASVPFFDLDYDGGQIAAVAERASLATSKVKLHNGSGYLMLATDVSDAIPGTQITMSGTGCTISFPSSMASTISIDSETGCTASYADGKATLLIPDKVFAVGTSSSYSASVRFLVGQFILDVSIAYSYDAAAGTVEGTVSTWGGGTLSFYNGTFRGTGKAVLFVQTTAPSITFGSRSGTAGGFSQAFGQGIIAQGDAQTAIGKYNVADSTSALIVGNGTADNARSNALTVDWSGNVEAAGDVRAGGSTPLVPIGTILDFAAATVPTGYLVCDGSAVSRTTYAALFAVIGTTWGSGNGSTTFNVPDLRGRTAIGAGTGTASDATAHALGSNGGTETHKLTAAQSGVPAHAHPLPNSAIVYNADGTQRLATSGSGTKSSVNTSVGLSTASNTAANASSAHPNMQPYAAVTKIIRAI